MRLTATVLSLLSFVGCGSRETKTSPERAGVSTPLAYPVLLIGQSSLDVRDSEAALASIRGASSLNLNERQILDSQGRLFAVTSAEPIAGQGSIMMDMGTSDRRYFVTVADPRRPAWPEIEALILDQVRAPSSTWAGDERAVQHVHELHDVAALIEASRETWNWGK